MRSNYWDKETEDEVAEQEEAAEKCECYDLTTAQARIAELEGELMLERAVCICGCDNSDHDFLGPDDGECCGNEDHMCLRVAPGIRAMYVDERARADTLQAQVERLTETPETVEAIRCTIISILNQNHAPHEVTGPISNMLLALKKDIKAALTPDRKGG